MALAVKKRTPIHRTNDTFSLPQKVHKREQRRQSRKRFSIFMTALVGLIVSGGIAYTWYNGKHHDAAALQPAPEYKAQAVFRPPKISSTAPLGVAQQSSMTQVKPGDNASVSVRTNPAAECTISVKVNNIPASDSGLTPKVADEFGVASWAWTVAINTPKGVWPVDILCKNKKNSAYLKVDLIVS